MSGPAFRRTEIRLTTSTSSLTDRSARYAAGGTKAAGASAPAEVRGSVVETPLSSSPGETLEIHDSSWVPAQATLHDSRASRTK